MLCAPIGGNDQEATYEFFLCSGKHPDRHGVDGGSVACLLEKLELAAME